MMSKQDYERVADSLAGQWATADDAERATIRTTVRGLVKAFSSVPETAFNARVFEAAVYGHPVKGWDVEVVIDHVERLANSHAGNPRWAVFTQAGARYVTSPNASINYDLGYFVEGKRWTFDLDGRGQITKGEEVKRG